MHRISRLSSASMLSTAELMVVAEGYDHIDKASLAPGFYVVTATYADGMKLAKKVAVR